MYVDFELLPDHARLWIYQASRKFSPSEEIVIREGLQAFCEQWVAHGEPLKTSFAIAYHQFLILAVDEGFNGASGCSIDGSVHILKTWQEQTGIDFFDRSKVAFLADGEVSLVSLPMLKEAFSTGTLGPATLTFNIQAGDKGEWEKEPVLAAGKTWLARYLPKSSVA